MPRTTRRSLANQASGVQPEDSIELSSRKPRGKAAIAIRQFVKNSSDVGEDLDDEVIVAAPPSKGKRKAFAVVVPTRGNSKAPSTVSASGASASSADFQDHDTPATSTAGTPFGADKMSRRKTASANLAKVNKRLSSARSARTRATKDEQEDADAKIAAMLQEQEYAEEEDEPGPPQVKAKTARRTSSKYAAMHDVEEDAEEVFGPSSSRGRSSAKKATPKKYIESDGDGDFDIAADDVSDFDAPEDATEEDDFNPDDSEEDVKPLKRKAKGKAPLNPRKRIKLALSSAIDENHKERLDGDGDSTALSSLEEDWDEVMARAKERRAAREAKFAKHKQTQLGPKPRRITREEWERYKLEKSHPMVKTLWDDLEKDVEIYKPVARPQPEGINRSLKSFQLQGVDWMRHMETDGRWKGGLLGDEMGMGKTIQAVSLIMSDYPVGKPSLVVVPPVALMQWSAEITSYTDGKLKVLVYHNADNKVKKLKKKDLEQYDVIMISYPSLESMHRKEVEGWKRDGGLVKENSLIHSMHFHRLILDEAHSIKTRTTKVARSCFALKSDYRWCLSGTPVQNRIGEFFSLLRFLEVHPFCSYFCKRCDCSSLHWEQDEDKSCSECGHRGFDHVSLFNQELLNPMTGGTSSDRKEAMRKLRLITDRIMLRRLKRDYTSSMELPPKQIVIHNEFFGKQERDFSKSIMSNTTREFDTYVARGVMLNNYANIFGLIMQMRQVANHPDLILKKNNEGGQNVLVCCICDDPAEEPVRSVCHHEFCRACVKDYIRGFTLQGSSPDCPRCHVALRIDLDQPDIEQDEDYVKKSSIVNRIKMEDWHSSTKIEMLIYDLYKLRSKKQTVKSIVFSQFTSMLHLIDWRLRRAGFSTVMLDGSMTPQARQKSINHFMDNIDVEIFMVSLKAGGVALNLTEASHVFIVDPWWNPAAEWQSADRVHRIGQRRPCVITRLVIEDSVESRMVMLQEKKANLINSTVNRDDVALDKLSPEDMQFLFRGS